MDEKLVAGHCTRTSQWQWARTWYQFKLKRDAFFRTKQSQFRMKIHSWTCTNNLNKQHNKKSDGYEPSKLTLTILYGIESYIQQKINVNIYQMQKKKMCKKQTICHIETKRNKLKLTH